MNKACIMYVLLIYMYVHQIGTTVQDEKSFISVCMCTIVTECHLTVIRYRIAKDRLNRHVKYGLALLDALFTDEEQATHCYKASGKSNSSSVSAKPPMSPGR